VLRTASTQAVAALRMTHHYSVIASEARQSGFPILLFLPLGQPAKPAHESVIASAARQSGVRQYSFHPLSS
jgi:hypothetical protein